MIGKNNIINNISTEQIDAFKKRIISSVWMHIYLIVILILAWLTDYRNDGFADFVSLEVKIVCSYLFFLITIWLIYFMISEISKSFMIKKNIKIFMLLSSITIQLICHILLASGVYGIININFTNQDNNLLLAYIYIITFIVTTTISIIIVKILLKNSILQKKNKKLFLLIYILINCFFFACYYLIMTKFFITCIFILFICIFFDTFAYIFGTLFGKNKMSKTISPNKTWEGAIYSQITTISLICAALWCAGLGNGETQYHIQSIFFGSQINDYFFIHNNYTSWWIISFILICLLSIASLFGDLAFSYIKRKCNIKDYGNTIPGHGGILDRLDSIIVVVTLYWLISISISIIYTFYSPENNTIFFV
jgi:phosphatidate cytidylyltransferase